MAELKKYFAIQDDFLRLVPKPEFPVVGAPTRSRDCFWKEDILPTTNEIRRFWIGELYEPEDEAMLNFVWEWLKNPENVKLLPESNSSDEYDRLPLQVVLNRSTARFFTMQKDFKIFEKPLGFEAFVAYKPGTDSWKNDVRGITFKYMGHLKGRRREFGPKADLALKQSRINGKIFQRVGLEISEELLDLYEKIDDTTWMMLMQYHLVLYQREKAVLFQLGLLKG